MTGCPRFDLCAEPWRRRLGERREDYVLINTSFPLINPVHSRGVEQEMATMIAAGWERSYVHALVEDLRPVFSSYLDCLARVTAMFSGKRFRLRPHPFEDPKLYAQLFSRHSNVEVNGEGSVASAIRRATCMLHLNCGSAIETAMLDCVPIQLEFLNTPFLRAHSPLPGTRKRPCA